jgi:hypothetical protein
MAKLFVSTMLYAASKKLGYQGAARELMRQVQNADVKNDEEPGMPVSHIIRHCSDLEECQVHVTAGATILGLARSLAAADFLDSGADVWLSADDDMRVSRDAIAALVSQARAEPCLVLTPYLMRETLVESRLAPRVCIAAAPVAVQDRAPSGGKIETVASGGFGCFAVSREVVQWAWDQAGPENEFVEKGRTARRVISDELVERCWVAEDMAFCRRISVRFRRWCVRVGVSIHAGQRLDLQSLEALVRRGELGPQSSILA